MRWFLQHRNNEANQVLFSCFCSASHKTQYNKYKFYHGQHTNTFLLRLLLALFTTQQPHPPPSLPPCQPWRVLPYTHAHKPDSFLLSISSCSHLHTLSGTHTWHQHRRLMKQNRLGTLHFPNKWNNRKFKAIGQPLLWSGHVSYIHARYTRGSKSTAPQAHGPPDIPGRNLFQVQVHLRKQRARSLQTYASALIKVHLIKPICVVISWIKFGVWYLYNAGLARQSVSKQGELQKK